MRVAHFIQRYPPALGGSEAYFARLSRFLAAHGDEVTVFTSNAVDLEAFWCRRGRSVSAGITHEEGIEIRRYPLWRLPGRRYLFKLLSFLPLRLWQCLTMPCNPVSPEMWRAAGHFPQRFDVVHASAFPYAWPIACARRLARRQRLPFFLTPFMHLGDPDDPHDPTRRAYGAPPLRWLLRQADRVFVQTPGEERAVRNLGVTAQKIVLQGLGVDPAECTGGNRCAARKEWGIDGHEIVLGHLANNSWEKGTIDLLKALLDVGPAQVPTRLLLAGPEMANFKAFWDDFARQHPQEAARVLRLGPLGAQQKRDFFSAIDLFVLPSRSDSFGLVLLEAWANGVPNIAYKAGGIADVIRHEQDGLLVPCGAIAELAQAISDLCADNAKRHRLGAKGKGRLAEEFKWTDKLELVRRQYSSSTIS